MTATFAIVLGRLALVTLALVTARRHREAIPVTVALVALVALDAARLLSLPPRVDLALYLIWPGIAAALMWHEWRRCFGLATMLPFVLCAAVNASCSWSGNPIGYAWTLRFPWIWGAGMALMAWSSAPKDPELWLPSPRGRRIAAALAWSNFVDLAIGAIGVTPSSWWVARGLSVVTWVAIGAILVGWARSPRSRTSSP